MTTLSMPRPTSSSPLSDVDLWRASRDGDRDAFGRIVERYQSLIASIAYSRTGDLATATDFAQETFVAAWRSRDDLREPSLLKSWLAGIARNLTANAAKRASRHGGAPLALDEIAEPVAREASPEARAVSRQEEELLWRTLSQLPESYREPLVLFYREECSIAEVATQLELSEDAVKQRLSRGRALLKVELATLVESALSRSRPGAGFTAGVLAAIALTAPTGAAVAATVSGGAAAAGATGAAVGKGTFGGVGGAVVAGPAAGLLTAWLASRLAAGTARSDDERRAIAAGFRRAFLFVFPMIALILGLVWAGTTRFVDAPAFLATATTLWTVALVGGLIGIGKRVERRIATLRASGGVGDAAWAAELARRGVAPARARRYESRLRFLGLPLFAYASGGVDAGAAFDGSMRRGARGWLAVGDLALSPLVAVGGVAIAPIAIGGVTLGLLSLSIAGVAVGALAVGSLAFGWVAFGIVGVGWKGAAGVTAIAHDFAIGTQASALHANTPVAASFFRDAWFTSAVALFGAAVPALILLAIVIPLGLMARRVWTLRRGASAARPAGSEGARVELLSPFPTGERLHGLDALRAGALLLGVVLHAAMPYVLPPGLWAVGTTAPVHFLGWLAYTLHSFRMETFFLLAGFFGALVVARRGVVPYVGDRLRRIVLVFLVALVPMKLALSALWIAGGRATGWLVLPPEYAELPWYELALGSLWIEKFPDLVLTHLWFLYYLAIVTGLFLGARAILVRFAALRATEGASRRLSQALASRLAPLGLALAVTPILARMTGMDIDTPDRTLRWHLPLLALYGLFFALGWWLERHRAALAPLVARWRPNLLLGLVASLVGSAVVGFRYSAAPWTLENAELLRWMGSFATAVTMALLVLGGLGAALRFGASPSTRVRELSNASYWIYLAHLPLVVGLQLLAHRFALPWWLAVPLVIVLTIALLLGADRIVVRSTWLGAWLNGRRR